MATGTTLFQFISEVGFIEDAGALVSSLIAEIGYEEITPGEIKIHATQLSTGSSWGTDLDATRLHMERDQFLAMEDTPLMFSGSATKNVIVNDDEDALIFGDTPVPIYQRVGEAVPFSSPTGQYWKIPEGEFKTGSVGVAFANGAVQIPSVDYDEQFAASGTIQFYQSPPTGSRVVVWWGV